MSSAPAPPRNSRRAAFGGALTDPSPDPAQPPPSQPPVRRDHKGKGKATQQRASSVASNGVAGGGGTGGQLVVKKEVVEVLPVLPVVDAVDDMCFICAETVDPEQARYWALGECGHRTCHTCSIRLRALYKRTECTFCKHDCTRVVFTASDSLPFSSFPASATPFSDTKLGLAFETREQMDDSLALLRFNCPDATCSVISLGWADIKRHVQADHRMSLCDLCCQHKKIFTHEHTLYPQREYQAHIANDHTTCEFCRITFYDSDLLYAHCRDKHEECFICVRSGIRHQYHRNYDRLEAHYKADHYLCPHPDCLAQKFVVFESVLDLQAHAVAIHGAAVQGDQRARKDARRIETNFTHEAPPVVNNRGKGKRRDDPPPPVAVFAHTIDAPHRNRFVPGLGKLSTESGLPKSDGRDAPPHRAGSSSTSKTPPAETVDATLEKHNALMKRVGAAVTSDSSIVSFKAAVRGYRGNEMSGADFVDTLWNIFDRQVDVAGGIITSVADLFEDAEKRQTVLSAWQDLRIEQNSFPSLAQLGPTLHGVPTTTKATTVRRATGNQQDPVTWARVERAAGSVTSKATPTPRAPAFPAIPGSRQVQRSTPWASGSSTPPISAQSSRAPTPVSQPSFPTLPSSIPRASFINPVAASASIRPRNAGMDFPSLPSSSTEADRRARVRAALSNPDPSILDVQVEAGTRWIAPGNAESRAGGWSGTSTRSTSPELSNGGGVGMGKKKKKPQKVLLMMHGSVRGA